MKYWKVEAKCGHVKRTKFVIKSFFVKAENGSEAAKQVRWTSRVKHHDKYAIKGVREISEEEYIKGLKKNASDSFFHVHSSQEQKAKCVGIEFETYYEEEPIYYKKKTNAKRHLVEKQLDAEWKRERNRQFYE